MNGPGDLEVHDNHHYDYLEGAHYAVPHPQPQVAPTGANLSASEHTSTRATLPGGALAGEAGGVAPQQLSAAQMGPRSWEERKVLAAKARQLKPAVQVKQAAKARAEAERTCISNKDCDHDAICWGDACLDKNDRRLKWRHGRPCYYNKASRARHHLDRGFCDVCNANFEHARPDVIKVHKNGACKGRREEGKNLEGKIFYAPPDPSTSSLKRKGGPDDDSGSGGMDSASKRKVQRGTS